jgi:hypothetical protein
MKIAPFLVAGVLALAVAGCAGNRFDRHFAAGNFQEVARLFEADSSLHADPAALYRAGLAYALPESPVYDPDRALEVFDLLQARHPKHPQREHVAQLQQLLRLADLQQERQLSRDARLRAQQTEIEELKAQLARERQRAETLLTTTERLEREARERDARLRALQEELAALKQIDLNRPSAGGAGVGERPRTPPR